MDAIKSSTAIKKHLLKRWKELDVSQSSVVQDAQEKGMKGITDQSISRWKKNPDMKGALNQMQVIFLAERWGIELQITVGTPVYVAYEVEPFNETKALSRLIKIFPDANK